MNNFNEIIGTDFDAEFTLEQLLPHEQIVRILDFFDKPDSHFMILYPNGNEYYSACFISESDRPNIKRIIEHEQIDSFNKFSDETGSTIAIFPLIHDLETICYMTFSCKNLENKYSIDNINLAHFIFGILKQLTVLNNKNLMTSRLHGKVVEESYYELKNRADKLEKSEQKYRILAEHLEQEVLEQSEKIKVTQAHLMQQEKMASIGQLAAGIAHEINNPMGFISSNLRSLGEYEKDIYTVINEYRSLAGILNEDMLTNQGWKIISEKIQIIESIEKACDMDFILEDFKDIINQSLDGAGRINKIVSDLKDFARPGENKIGLTDINRGLDSTLNIVWNELRYKAEVIKNYGNIPRIPCHSQKINQVFMNILVNAAQSIEQKGIITIETELVDDFIEIRISDTGIGIPEKQLPKIFDPFFTTKEVGKGTGLGLNTAYNIVNAHKGQIKVKSDINKGTTFIIRLPLSI